MRYDWDFSFLLRYTSAFGKGCLLTLELSLLAIFFGTIIGIILGWARISRIWIIRNLSLIYVNLFLAFPVLVLLVWIDFCVPLIFPIIKIQSFWSAVVALTLSLSAFVAEIVRAGMESVPKGQLEAAFSLGFTHFQAMRRIVFPQAQKIIWSPLLGQYITTLKLSSLASVIAVYELLHTANNVISQTYRPLETYTFIAVIYLIMILPLIFIMNKLEIRLFKRRQEKTLLDILRWEWNS